MNNYDFPPFQLRPAQGVLLAHGAPIALRPKSWSVLCYLIEHRQRAVSKDELLAQVWNGLVVHEQAVFQSISEIRATLQPLDCIQTLRGRGYRWNVDSHTRAHRLPAKRRLWWARAAMLCTLVVAGLTGSVQRMASPVPTLVLVTHPDSDMELPVDLLRRALPAVRVEGAPILANADYRLEYQFRLAGPATVLSYTLGHAGHQIAGQLEGTTAATVQDLAAEISPFILQGYSPAQLAQVFRILPAANQAVEHAQPARAREHLQALLERVPDYPPAQLALAQQALASDDLTLAGGMAQAVVDSGRREALGRVRMQAQLLLSQLAQRTGQSAEARKWADSARRSALAGGDDYLYALSQEHLAATALSSGDYREARAQLLLARSLYAGFCPQGERRVQQQLQQLNFAERS